MKGNLKLLVLKFALCDAIDTCIPVATYKNREKGESTTSKVQAAALLAPCRFDSLCKGLAESRICEYQGRQCMPTEGG